MTDPTKAIKHRWAGVLDRLAQGPDGYGPHDIEALCGALQRVVEERDEARQAAAVEAKLGDEARAEVKRLRADLHTIWTTCTGVVSTHADGPDADNIPRRVEEMRGEVERLRRLALVPMSGPPESEGDYIVARLYSDGTTGAVVVRVEDYLCPTIGGSELHVSEAGSGDMVPVQHTEDRFIFRIPVEALGEVARG